jgi:hypothetical protein
MPSDVKRFSVTRTGRTERQAEKAARAAVAQLARRSGYPTKVGYVKLHGGVTRISVNHLERRLLEGFPGSLNT